MNFCGAHEVFDKHPYFPIDMMRLLLGREDIDVNANNGGSGNATALHAAVLSGSVRQLQRLMFHPTLNVLSTDSNGEAAIVNIHKCRDASRFFDTKLKMLLGCYRETITLEGLTWEPTRKVVADFNEALSALKLATDTPAFENGLYKCLDEGWIGAVEVMLRMHKGAYFYKKLIATIKVHLAKNKKPGINAQMAVLHCTRMAGASPLAAIRNETLLSCYPMNQLVRAFCDLNLHYELFIYLGDRQRPLKLTSLDLDLQVNLWQYMKKYSKTCAPIARYIIQGLNTISGKINLFEREINLPVTCWTNVTEYLSLTDVNALVATCKTSKDFFSPDCALKRMVQPQLEIYREILEQRIDPNQGPSANGGGGGSKE